MTYYKAPGIQAVLSDAGVLFTDNGKTYFCSKGYFAVWNRELTTEEKSFLLMGKKKVWAGIQED